MSSIERYLNLVYSDILLYLLLLFLAVSILFFIKRATLPFILALSSPLVLLFVYLSSAKAVLLIVSSFLLALLSYLKLSNRELDYRKDVFSLSMFFNLYKSKRDDEKFIGRIMPYNSFQLPHNKKLISLRDEYARGLVMITGSPGSGKTYGMMSMIKQDMDNGKRVVYFDYKGDEKIIKELREAANQRGIPIFEMSEYRNNFNYDPLMHLNKTGKIEALLNTRKWSMDGSDAHYRTSTQLIIQKYVDKFEDVYDGKKPYTVSFYEFIKTQNYDRQSADAYHTLTKMIELLLTSQTKDMWYGNNEKDFSFKIEDQYLAIFSFVSSNKELANSMSSFLFKDMLDTGTIKEYNKELAVYVDEYGTLENSMIAKDTMEKGRSCGILTTISMQDINQIVINTNQAYLNSILGIVNTFIVYSGSTKLTAEMLGGVQLYDIESIMVTLRKPDQKKGKPPTAMYISRYSTIERDKSIDVFKIKPYSVTKEVVKEEKAKRHEPYQPNATHPKETELQDDIQEVGKDDYMKFL